MRFKVTFRSAGVRPPFPFRRGSQGSAALSTRVPAKCASSRKAWGAWATSTCITRHWVPVSRRVRRRRSSSPASGIGSAMGFPFAPRSGVYSARFCWMSCFSRFGAARCNSLSSFCKVALIFPPVFRDGHKPHDARMPRGMIGFAHAIEFLKHLLTRAAGRQT